MKKLFLLSFILLAAGCESNAQKSQSKKFPIQKSDSEWKAELSSQEYKVLRKKGTEMAFTSELLDIKEPGAFVCAACGNELYRTENKFNSGTGWPSFDRAYKNENLVYRPDMPQGPLVLPELLTTSVVVAGLWTAREAISAVWPYGGFSWGRLAFSQSQSPLGDLVAWLGALRPREG